VVLTAPFVAVLLGLVFLTDPLALTLTLIPGAIVVGAFVWLDRVEPEPHAERVHAFLWGAAVASLLGAAANELAAWRFGHEWALVVSAPVGEEILKALGVFVAVRRRRLHSWFDGVVYAGFVAAGFALVENAVYFLEAAATDQLPVVFVGRGLATPFAHPLFTMFTGIFVGRFAVSRFPRSLLGLPIAIALHAGWNAATLLGTTYAIAMLVSAVLLFWTVLVVLVLFRVRTTRIYARMLPVLAFRFGFDPSELAVLADWAAVLRSRATLPVNRLRPFEELHAAALRVGRRVAAGEEVTEREHAELQRARAVFSARRLPPPAGWW
jgi:RsiW-degrading membrane proteinase PrsW (M82 family)